MNMDDAKIDDDADAVACLIAIKSPKYTNKMKIIASTNHRSPFVVTCIPEIGTKYRTRNRPVPESGTRSVKHTVQKLAPIFGADIRRRNLDCVSSA